ncbi:MAG: hypothetical protein Kapaf2KO_12860 [Candidatus Kapaibacteriales bacterium]
MKFELKNIKHISIAIITSLAILVSSCSEDKERKWRFINAYTDMLKARVSHTNSIEAQYAVDSVLESHGFTLQTFGEEFEYVAENYEDFPQIIDSLRSDLENEAKRTDSIQNAKVMQAQKEAHPNYDPMKDSIINPKERTY